MVENIEKNYLLREIINRLKELEGVSGDLDLAIPLKVTKRNVSSYKERGTIPWEVLLEYGRRRKVSMEWLLNGRGPIDNEILAVAEPGVVYKVETNQDAVYDIAAQVYTELLAEGKQPGADKFRQLVKLLHRSMLETGQIPTADKIKEIIILI
jgi:hypothetical protein